MLTTAMTQHRAPIAQLSCTSDFWPASNPESWQTDPKESFRAWLAERRIMHNRGFREASFETYCAMFSAWVSFLKERNLGVLDAKPQDATSFFQQQELEPVSRRRYLQILDKVYRHLLGNGWTGENPMRGELRMERALPAGWPRGLSEAALCKLMPYLSKMQGWKGSRDRAIFALTVGAGLRNNELVTLRKDALEPAASHTIHVVPGGVHKPHTTTVLPFFQLNAGDGTTMTVVPGAWLTDWFHLRQEENIPGVWAVPSTKSGKAYSSSGIFRRIAHWFEAAGIHPGEGGVNILRNTFAQLAFQSGRYSLKQIQEFMGHEHSRATERYARK